MCDARSLSNSEERIRHLPARPTARPEEGEKWQQVQVAWWSGDPDDFSNKYTCPQPQQKPLLPCPLHEHWQTWTHLQNLYSSLGASRPPEGGLRHGVACSLNLFWLLAGAEALGPARLSSGFIGQYGRKKWRGGHEMWWRTLDDGPHSSCLERHVAGAWAALRAAWRSEYIRSGSRVSSVVWDVNPRTAREENDKTEKWPYIN